MQILEDVPLSDYSTMRLGGVANYLTKINDRDEISEVLTWANNRQLPILVIGGGSNIVWRDEGFSGLVIVNHISGYDLKSFDETTASLTIGGGENWDQVVEQTVKAGYYTLAPLSLIPGTAGAAPVQNIGAYGSQLSDALSDLEAYDLHKNKFVTFLGSECDFGYRTSRFKSTDKNRFLITKITVQLDKNSPKKEEMYHSLNSYLTENDIQTRTPQVIRDAVVNIRNSKLPDPKTVANCGSFFANPIITTSELKRILDAYPDLASWHSKFIWELPNEMVKIAAGALLEHAGYKDFHDPITGMATWSKQALVLVNEHAKNTADLLIFKQKIIDTIQQKYHITLEQEPELLP